MPTAPPRPTPPRRLLPLPPAAAIATTGTGTGGVEYPTGPHGSSGRHPRPAPTARGTASTHAPWSLDAYAD
ncbi:hypothetical protein AB0E96_27665 [Kitasatospora sp. NPDC036755]|uniref:hypothetical protein n=1 Tax=Kitasatospora sp. NPDC036755 TaxID=3154600 RepID=UPI0033DAA147